MLGTCLDNVRKTTPLVHNITNYVTVNDVANVLLACGGSPIMSDDIQDVEDITSICGGLNLNIGTLNHNTIPSMFAAGKKANQLGHPVVLDPVGAGASALRTETALKLLEEVKFAVIRGNISEVKTLAIGSGKTRGGDADVADAVTEDNLDASVAFAKAVAARFGAVVAITGAIDLVADVLCHPQRPPGDGEDHRHRLPALRPHRRLRGSQPGPASGSGGGGRGLHGPGRGDRLEPHAAHRRQLHLPQPDHRRHLSPGWGGAGQGGQV